MYTRLKELRSKLNLTQSDFAKSLGIGQSTLGMMEVGKREISERHIKTICAIYNVNEEWLRNGTGEMLIQTPKNILDELVTTYSLTEKETAIVSAFLDLSSEGRAAIIEYVEKAARKLSAASVSSTPTRDEIINNDIIATEKKIQEITKKEV